MRIKHLRALVPAFSLCDIASKTPQNTAPTLVTVAAATHPEQRKSTPPQLAPTQTPSVGPTVLPFEGPF